MTTLPVITDTQKQLQALARNNLLKRVQARTGQPLPSFGGGPIAQPQPSTPLPQPSAFSPAPAPTNNPLGGTPLGQGTFATGLGEGLAQGLKGFAGIFTGNPATPYDRPFAPASGFAQEAGRYLGTVATLGMGVPSDPYAGVDYSQKGDYGLNVPTLLKAVGYYAPAGAEAAMVGPAFKGYAGAAAQRTGRVVGAAVKGGERGFASFGEELSNVDKELAALDQRIAAAAKAGKDTAALESERAATQELRQNTIEARMTEDQVTQYRDLQQRQQALQGQLDAQAAAKTANIVRPPKATPGGLGLWSNAKLKALAEHEGVDPYREDWWDSLDSKVVAEFRSTRVPTAPVTAAADLRKQLSEVSGQLQAFESGKTVTPKAQTLEQYLKEHGVSDYTDAGLHSPRGNMGRQANRAIAKRMDASYAAYTRAKQDYDQLVRAGALIDPLRGKSVITPSEETLAAQQRVAERRAARIGSLQSGMGIGEKPAQGQLLGEFQGKGPEQTPLIDTAQVQAQAAKRAEVAAGQRTLPEAPAGAPPQKPPVVPPTTTGGELPPQKPSTFAANIRLAKYPEDIRSAIKDWADVHPTEVQTARRGVRSDAQVQEDARTLVEQMGGDFAKVQRRWKPGEAWNAEEVTAIRGVLRQKTEAVMAAAKAAQTEDTTANHANLLLALEEQARVQGIVHGVTAEAGRSLRAFRQEVMALAQHPDAARMEELLRRYGGQDREKLGRIAKMLTTLDTSNPIAVNDFIRNLQKPSLWDYLTELYYNSILSGPKTHIINTLSNTVTALSSPIERAGSAVVESGLSRLQGRAAERTIREVPADVFGSVQGLSEGVRDAFVTLRTGISPSKASKWEFRPHAFTGKTGRVINAPSTALEAADTLFYAINYRAALNATAMRMARGEGLRGQQQLNRVADIVQQPSEALIRQASAMAEYRLFRNDPGAFTNVLLRLRGTVPGLQFIIPFLRTPTNILKFGLTRSPVGFLNPSLYRNLAAKSPEASDQIARATLGSILAAFIAWKFHEGRITGAAPSSQAERDRFYREGKQPFAVRIGDTWVQYQRLEPFNQPLSQVAATVEAVQAGDKAVDAKAAQAVATLAQNLVSQTYLSGIAQFINALSDPQRSAGKLFEGFAAGAIPASSALRTAAQIQDPTVRNPSGIAERMKAGIPVLSQQVPATLTAFGQEAQRQSPPWSPIGVTKAQQSAVDAELARLGEEVGFVGASAGGTKLTNAQRDTYQRMAGQIVYTALLTLFSDPSYQGATIEQQRVMEQHTEAQAKAKAEGVFMLQEHLPGAPSLDAARAVAIQRMFPNRPSLRYGDLPALTRTIVDKQPEVQQVMALMDAQTKTRLVPTQQERAAASRKAMLDKLQRLRGATPTPVMVRTPIPVGAR